MPHFLNELQHAFVEHARRPAIVHRNQTLTHGELDARARTQAAELQRLGIEPGDRVALCASEKLPLLIAHLGALYAGAVSLPLNPRYTPDELRYFLSDSGTRLAIVGAENFAQFEVLQRDLPDLRHVLTERSLEDVPTAVYRELQTGAVDACMLIYSSGTTGWPKGVVHTHASLAAGLRAVQSTWRVTPDDAIINSLPLFHVHGLCFALQMPLLAGACVHIEDSFDARRMLDTLGQGTLLPAVPPMYYRFLELPEFRAAARNWPHMRLFTCGSAPIRPEVLPELEAILSRPIINRYGMTEAMVITSLPLDGPWPHGSVGLPLAGVEMRIVREDGSPAAVREVGAVRVRGPNLFREYWRKPEATREAFASGWFDTGDLGCVDSVGYLTLVGRKNDLIITNGYNVYPPVVERVVNDCPGVKESAIVGVPDDRRGERVVAVVVRSDSALDEAALARYWSDRLVDYQQPRQVVFVEALPRNAMGKVVRRELQEWLGRMTDR